MHQVPAQRPASGRHRPRPFERPTLRPAAVIAAYRTAHPTRLPAIGRRERRALATAARDRFLVASGAGRYAVEVVR